MTEPAAHTQAVAESRFFAHLALYAVSTAVLLGVNLVAEPDPLWAAWLAVGWGLAVLSHAVAVFRFLWREDWIRARTRALSSDLSESRVYRILDEVLTARSVPAGTAQALRQLQRRMDEIEGRGVAPRAVPPPGAASVREEGLETAGSDPFDLESVQAADRPAWPTQATAPTGDPFSGVRSAVDTPVLDGPRRRR